jgi:hypothetical protein
MRKFAECSTVPGVGLVILLLAACGGTGVQSTAQQTSKPTQTTPPSGTQCSPDLRCAP